MILIIIITCSINYSLVTTVDEFGDDSDAIDVVLAMPLGSLVD